MQAKSKSMLDEVLSIVTNAARDMHGVFYEPQSVMQDVAEALGMPAPDRAIDEPSESLVDAVAPNTKNYTVEWKINVFGAVTPTDAARQALGHIRRPGSLARVFAVREENSKGKPKRSAPLTIVDLTDGTERTAKKGEW